MTTKLRNFIWMFDTGRGAMSLLLCIASRMAARRSQGVIRGGHTCRGVVVVALGVGTLAGVQEPRVHRTVREEAKAVASGVVRLLGLRRVGRSARALTKLRKARLSSSGGRGRIVSGFGEEREDDVTAAAASRDTEQLLRAKERNREGTRGDMVGFDGQQLSRSAGGAWYLSKK